MTEPFAATHSSFCEELRQTTVRNAATRKSLDEQAEIETANRIQEACYVLFTKLEADLAPSIFHELNKRALEGHSNAHINFDRATFSDTGIGRPRDVMRMFLDELSNPTSAIRTAGRHWSAHGSVD